MTETNRSCRYLIKERLFTLGNAFKIKDESGHVRYIVRSKKWTLKKKLVIEDTNGNAILKIRENGVRFLDQFHILSARDVIQFIPSTANIKSKDSIYSIIPSY
ncbi:unnamed protein product [Adineta ricciae]|uniref:Uncharacterized protein n=1 Tax=Adineta ricciae TaxID=249248 RepID=A0A814DS87_ADIRI|nr:unnamed protein product [Adineta ricciae]